MQYKESIAFYCCTNGLGHYKRVYEVSKYLIDFFNITIFCNQNQVDKIGTLEDVHYEYYEIDNIRWDWVTNGQVDRAVKQYYKWSAKYNSTTQEFDIIVSDNLPALLISRPDTILMGSFLWKDVFEDYIGVNDLSKLDTILLREHNPILITNKYVETQSVKTYKNKLQTGFGCEERKTEHSEIEHIVLQYPSLQYLDEYVKYLDTLNTVGITKDLSYINNTCIIARPGVGTITHCVEHGIPLVALYSDKDSREIIELAQKVEELGIGIKQNIKDPFNIESVKFQSSKLKKDGYKHIANYLKSYEIRNRR